uniref:Ankyrin repeat domain 39 n=1 Tax=Crocodylus porosus TaxID=8502 RepID=A0A7M4FHY0_CROPO
MAAPGPGAHGCACPCSCSAPVACQSLAEMDFQRGLWGAALDGDLGRVRALSCGHLAVARLLLSHGADPARADADGMSSLHKAAAQGHEELCALLLQHSPDLRSARDARSRTPRDLAPPRAALQHLLAP